MTEQVISFDSIIPMEKIFSEKINESSQILLDTVIAGNYNMEYVPEWYFFILIGVILVFAWIKLIYTKFLNDLFSSVFNYHLSQKVYNEAGIVRKHVGYALIGIYNISGALYLFVLSRYFNIIPFGLSGIQLFFFFTGLLLAIMVFRIILTRLIAVIFVSEEKFSEFIYHFYSYNKILGLLLLPFLLFIPYTEGLLQQILVITSLCVVGLVYFTRLIRILIFIIKNVVFLFYLFLYLCVLEILPLLVIIRLVLSLRQSS